jgi:tetraacyldisaccharide 4'-kinase
VLYGTAVDGRNLLYEIGVLGVRRADVPVVSIGGLTAGGSGKTPIAAEVARWALADGWRPVVVTPGLCDEMSVHEILNPEIPVVGGRDRLGLIERASSGADVAILDSGFQHRGLERDVEIVSLDAIALGGSRRRLPAGPFRERLSELRRADAVLVVRRDLVAGEVEEEDEEIVRLARWLRGLGTPVPVVAVRIAPGPLVALNDAARAAAAAEVWPRVAVAGVMYPEPFFRAVDRRFRADGAPPTLERIGLPDHFAYGDRDVEQLVNLAGSEGIACTLKDAVKIAPQVGERAPVWYLSERVEAGALRELVTGVLQALRDDGRPPVTSNGEASA